MDYAKMTVPQLRAECKRRGLPCYQSKGKRLRKADLVKQLGAVSHRPKNAHKTPAKRPRIAHDVSVGDVRKTSAKRPCVAHGNSVGAADLDALPTHRLWEMCRGQDRLFDPAADRRACLAYLLASGKSVEELTAKRRVDRPTATLADRGGWVDRGRSLGVRTL